MREGERERCLSAWHRSNLIKENLLAYFCILNFSKFFFFEYYDKPIMMCVCVCMWYDTIHLNIVLCYFSSAFSLFLSFFFIQKDQLHVDYISQ